MVSSNIKAVKAKWKREIMIWMYIDLTEHFYTITNQWMQESICMAVSGYDSGGGCQHILLLGKTLLPVWSAIT